MMNSYYLFKAVYCLVGNPTEYDSFSKKFKNEYLILAREAAFEYYDNIIHGMLLAQELIEREANEIIDRGIREILDVYINPKTFSTLSLGLGESEMTHSVPDYLGNEISISLITDEENIFTIHSITKDDSEMPNPVNMHNLESEYNYYMQNGYDTKDHHTIVGYFDSDEYEEGFEETAFGTHSILNTPFDWTGYDKKGWWE